MIVIEPSYTIETPKEWFPLATRLLEKAGRTCYKSEDKIEPGSDLRFLAKIVSAQPMHGAVIEHFSMTVRFICDRGVSHEWVRHRLASYCQESTRYCNYSKDKFGKEITVIRPRFFEMGSYRYDIWKLACQRCEEMYFTLLHDGAKPEEARAVLPNSLKTEIVVTANLREWRTVFEQRTSPRAHPQMRQLMIPLLREVKQLIPVIFDDFNPQGN